MRVTLEIMPVSGAPRFVGIERGHEVVVGSAPPAEVILTNDPAVSPRHFALAFDGDSCRIRSLDRIHTTLLNSRSITAALVNDGDLIIVGRTLVRVHIGDEMFGAAAGLEQCTPAIPPPASSLADVASSVPEPTLHERVLDILRAQRKPLFAVLDAARDPLISARLVQCGEEYQSLYEGPKAAALADVAPHLVAIPQGSPFLDTLVLDGWGKSWGIYLTCDRPFRDARKHLRRLLTVEIEGGKKLLFRFYDPRVLRVYLPTCTAEETGEFFGPIENFLMEGMQPESVLTFSHDRPGADPARASVVAAEKGL
jgi:hypothetical protein